MRARGDEERRVAAVTLGYRSEARYRVWTGGLSSSSKAVWGSLKQVKRSVKSIFG